MPAAHVMAVVCRIRTLLPQKLAVLYHSFLPKPDQCILVLIRLLLLQSFCHAKTVTLVSFPYLNATPDLFAHQLSVLPVNKYLKLR